MKSSRSGKNCIQFQVVTTHLGSLMEISNFIAPNCTEERKSKTWRLQFGMRKKAGKSRSGSRKFVLLVTFRSARTSWSGLLVDEVGLYLKMLFKLWMLSSRKQSTWIPTSTTLVGHTFTQKE